MIIEERNYLTVPGGVARYVELWNEFGRAPQIEHLGEPLGVHAVEIGALNTLVFHWQYTDLNDRAARRNGLAADADFAAFRAHARGLLVTQSNRILTPLLDSQIGNRR